MPLFSYRCVRIALLGLLATACSPSSGAAQQRNPFDPTQFFNDPSKIFEQILGLDNEKLDAEIRKVTINRDEERKFGKQVVDAYLQQLKQKAVKIQTRGREVAYLQSLVATLKPQMKRGDLYPSIRVVFVDSEEVDARSVPGGTLLFTRGMLETTRSEAALVGVVGHELSHLDRRHQIINVQRMKYISRAFTAQNKGFDFQRLMRANGAMMQTFLKPYRPEEELEADRDAAIWMHQTGYEIDEFIDLFRRFERRRDRKHDALLPGFLRSHPLNADRIKAVRTVAITLRREAPLDAPYVGVTNLKTRTPRSEREFDR